MTTASRLERYVPRIFSFDVLKSRMSMGGVAGRPGCFF
jgi:hypothetical protein